MNTRMGVIALLAAGSMRALGDPDGARRDHL